MFDFSANQFRYEIGDIRVGGQPGLVPTVLIGSLFYSGHKIVYDVKTGQFNQTRAKQLLDSQDRVSQITGNPYMIDLVAETPEAMQRYIDFVTETTTAPFLVDSTSTNTRIAAIKYAKEIGLLDRVIYNSIMPAYHEEELEAIRNIGLQQVLLLAFNEHLTTTTGRITAIKDHDGSGLFDLLQKIGVSKLLIDTCVLDIPSLGMACQAIYRLKDQFGFVCGCGAHNAIETWRGLKTKFRSGLRETGAVTASVIAAGAGADFVLYGPIEHAEAVFPMVAMVDAAWGQLHFEKSGKVDLQHPLFKIA